MIGQTFGHHRLTALLGEGSYGAVYRAAHLHDGQLMAAVKVVHPALVREPGFIEALRRECRSLDRLDHPGIVRFRDLFVDGERVAMLLELLEGEDLEAILARGPQPVPWVIQTLERSLDALAYAHGRGVVHRDIKPANLYACSDGRIKLMDFGLAYAADDGAGTRSGQLRGTLDYMAPERFRGERPPACDVYALGLVAWELLVGRRACAAGDMMAKLGWHLSVGAPDVRLHRPDCPAWLAELIAKMTARGAGDRPADGSAALNQLNQRRSSPAPQRSAPRMTATALQPPPTVTLPPKGSPSPAPNVKLAETGAPQRLSTVTAAPRPPTARSYELRQVPAGKYTIGDTRGFRWRSLGDEAVREVHLSLGVMMGVTPVPQALYSAVMGENPSNFNDGDLRRPVERVSWFDAARFANRLSQQDGLEEAYIIKGDAVTWPKGIASQGYRLPTEAEWEVAARGGKDTHYAGADHLDDVGWYTENSDAQTHPVAQRAPNGYDLYDMSGNVFEWTWDWFAATPPRATDPTGRASGATRVIRGGSWKNPARAARLAARCSAPPDTRSSGLGFRLVRTAE